MFCTNCQYTSFDQLESCPACGANWEQIKKKLNLDWLQGDYPLQPDDYVAQGFSFFQSQDQAESKMDKEWQQQEGQSQQAPPAKNIENTAQDTGLEFTWDHEPETVKVNTASNAAQKPDLNQTGQDETWLASAKQTEDQEIAYPELEREMLELKDQQGISDQAQPGPEQWDLELDPEAEEVDITALFDEIESDLDARPKKQ